MPEVTRPLAIWRFQAGALREAQDTVVVEHECDIAWNGRTLVRLACTPQHLEELAAGFLLTSGYLERREDLAQLLQDPTGARVEAETVSGSASTVFDLPVQADGCLSRPVPRLRELAPVTTSLCLEPVHISRAMRQLQTASQLFRTTGGVHVAALAREDGSLAAVYEDIGRHNAVDKAAGALLLGRAQGVMLVLSGRISTDLVQKAVRMRLPVVVSRSAPTHAAVAGAQQSQLTLIGFARGGRFNVYSHGERVVGFPGQ